MQAAMHREIFPLEWKVIDLSWLVIQSTLTIAGHDFLREDGVKQ